MKAAVMRDCRIVFDQVPEPIPGPGQVLVRTLARGICGSDLHFLRHAPELLATRDPTSVFTTTLDRDIVMGHEFCAEVAAYESSLLEIPARLPTDHAAPTEPMAVALDAVLRGQPQPDDVVLVIGCGPIGLAVVQSLRLHRVHAIVAADYSPRRRELALQMGADVAVDPKVESPCIKWLELALAGETRPSPLGDFFPPMPGLRPALFFECVGGPGVIAQMMEGAPPGARIVVVGACMQEDQFLSRPKARRRSLASRRATRERAGR